MPLNSSGKYRKRKNETAFSPFFPYPIAGSPGSGDLAMVGVLPVKVDVRNFAGK
jgi:hypothetical protein